MPRTRSLFPVLALTLERIIQPETLVKPLVREYHRPRLMRKAELIHALGGAENESSKPRTRRAGNPNSSPSCRPATRGTRSRRGKELT